MRTKFLLPILLLALTTQVGAAQEPSRTVSTSGDATLYVVPDEVIVGVGVETFEVELGKVKAENDTASARLIKAITGLGVEQRHIQTDTLGIEIRYKNSSHPSQGIEGFFARRQYSITLKEVKQLEKLLSVAIENGANQILGIEYRTKDLRKHRDEARKMAIRAAREKAEALAGELGARLGPVQTISEGGGFSYWGQNRLKSNSNVGAEDGGEADEATPLGQLGVRANVSLVFALKD